MTFGATPSWKDDIDAIRPELTPHKITLTDEQAEFLKYARSGERPLSYPRILELWQKYGWGKVSRDWLRNKACQIESDKNKGE